MSDTGRSTRASLHGTDKASRCSEDSQLKAPLYNDKCITLEDEAALIEAERKLSADVAERTLMLIEDIVQSFDDVSTDHKAKKGLSSSATLRRAREMYANMFWLLLWCGAGVAIIFVWIQDLNRALRCQARYEACISEGGTRRTCPPILVSGVLQRSLVDACRMDTVIHFQGSALWRWLLVALLFWPLELVAYAVARLSSGISMMLINTTLMQGSVLFTIVGLWRPLKYVVRAGLFLGLWFTIMARPVQWAKQAEEWQAAAPETARAFSWTTNFLSVHRVVWRILLVFLLYTTVGLIKSALGKHLSIHTHHAHHFPRMQEALVHETIIQQLSKPYCLSPHATVQLDDRKLMLRAYGPAHWAALQYVKRLIGHIGFWEEDDHEDGFIDGLRNRAEQLRYRLSCLLCSEFQMSHKKGRATNPVAFLRKKSFPGRRGAMQPPTFEMRRVNSDSKLTSDVVKPSSQFGGVEPHLKSHTISRYSPVTAPDGEEGFSWGMPSQAGGGGQGMQSEQHSLHQSTSILSRTPSPPSQVTENENECIRISLPGTAADGGGTGNGERDQGNIRIRPPSFMSVPGVSQRRDTDRESVAASRAGTDMLSILASRKPRTSFEALPKWGSVPEWGSEDTDAEERPAQTSTPTSAKPQVQAAVQQMLTYLTDNSYIRVFSLEPLDGDDNEETEALRNRAHVRQLGYWMFFNLRQTSVGVGLAERDVRRAAQQMRLNENKSWALLSRGATATATLEEVLGALEDVYAQRKQLSRALANNQTVVQQVETALGVVLAIVWVFVAAAIFDPGTVQVTWTALSAVFLSMSFIFGNAVRQVFENSIFLFQNSFYVGETISIEGTRYDVNNVTLQKVHLTRVDGADVSIPTSEMTKLRLHNITRSKPLWEGIHVAVDMDTPEKALHHVAYHVVAAMKLQPKLFGGDYRVWFEGFGAGYKKEIVLWFNHAGPGADLVDYGLAQTVLVAAVADGLEQAGVRFTLPPVQNDGGPAATRTIPIGQSQGAWKRIAAVEQVPAVRDVATEHDVNQITMAAAAKNLILLS